MDWTTLIAIILGAGIAFLLGMNYGVYRDRRWRRQMEWDEQKFLYYQGQVDQIRDDILAQHQPRLEWFDRVN